jgi:hypothetical protein
MVRPVQTISVVRVVPAVLVVPVRLRLPHQYRLEDWLDKMCWELLLRAMHKQEP